MSHQPLVSRFGWALCLVAIALLAPAASTQAKDEKDDKAAAKASDKPDDKKSDEKPAEKAKPKKVTLARLVLKQDFPESTGAAGIFSEMRPRLREVVERLDRAAKDDKIQGVILAIRSPEIGLGKVAELRDAIARVRKSGKKVYADLISGENKDYLIAAACDEIIMPPSGSLVVNGLQAEVTYFKGLLDKLGLKADFIQIGDFKGAAEPMTRTTMSDEFRKQFSAVIDDYYEQLVRTICQDRKLKEKKVEKLIDEGLFTAERAEELGLIDKVIYEDELLDELKKSTGAAELVVDREYGKKKVDTDFSGITGFMKLLEIMMGVEHDTKPAASQKIAIVYAVGPIVDGDGTSGMFSEEAAGGDTIVKALRKAKQDSAVKAIVLRVDSPGGSALASDLIWREIIECKKPVVASMGDTAASGGYYISMGADEIFAEPGTLTGSIGVVGGKLATKGLMDKIGVTTETIRRGKNSGIFSSSEPFSASERAAWKRVMTDIYKQFTSKAADGRGLELDEIEALAQGRLFTGRQAAENGLVDKVGSLNDAIASAKRKAGIKADEKVELQILPEAKSFFEELFGGNSITEEAASPRMLSSNLGLPTSVNRALRQATTWLKLFEKPGVTIMPFAVEIK